MSLDDGLFPHRPPVDRPDPETRVVTLDTEEAATLCRSLGSEMATSILARLFEEPMTASDVADHVDTSLQNAHYHLERLEEAGLIDVVDTWYSSRGVEMNVYAAMYEEFVIVPPTVDDARAEESAASDRSPPGDDAEETAEPEPPLVVGPSS